MKLKYFSVTGALLFIAAAIPWAWLVSYAYNARLTAYSVREISVVAISIVLISGLMLWRQSSISLLGFPGVYFLYMAFANLGAVVASLLVQDPFSAYRTSSLLWTYSDLLPYAIALAGIGVGVFVFVAIILSSLFGRAVPTSLGLDERGDRGLYMVGMLLLIGGALYMVSGIAVGILPIGVTYEAFKAATLELSGYAYVLFALTSGLTMVAATGNRRELSIGILWFLVSGVILLATGNRGEVLYPVAAAVAVVTRRGYRPNLGAVFTFFVTLFFIVPFIRDIRNDPPSAVSGAMLRLQFTEPIVEIGFQLRTVVATLNWTFGGEQFANGGTYMLPILRGASRIFPFIETPALQGNQMYIAGRLPTQGYSVIAEAYFNFGLLGILIVPAIIAAILVLLGERSTNSRSLAFAGAISGILITNVRNSFLFVPGQMILVVVLYLFAMLLNRLMRGPYRYALSAEQLTAGSYEPATSGGGD